MVRILTYSYVDVVLYYTGSGLSLLNLNEAHDPGVMTTLRQSVETNNYRV